MLLTYLQACHDTSKPSVESGLTFTRGVPLRIPLENRSLSIIGRRVPSFFKLLTLSVSALASTPDERPFGLIWVVAERKEVIERAHHVAEPAEEPCSVLTHLEKLHKAETRERWVVRYPSSAMEKRFRFRNSASIAECSLDTRSSAQSEAHLRSAIEKLDRTEESTSSFFSRCWTRWLYTAFQKRKL